MASNGYSYACERFAIFGDVTYRLSWTVDYYHPNNQLRYTRHFTRYADVAGARRFCKKHNLKHEE